MRTRISLAVLAVGTIGVLAACSGGGEQAPRQNGDQQQQQQASPEEQANASVDKQRAGDIATGKYGGKVLNVESDHAKGKPAWEVEIKDSKEGRIEVDVLKQGGQIAEMEKD